MEKIIKIRLFNYQCNGYGSFFYPVFTARYNTGDIVSLFLSSILPNRNIKECKVFLNTGSNKNFFGHKIPIDYFEQVENAKSFLHLLIVTGNNRNIEDKDEMYRALEKDLNNQEFTCQIKKFLSVSETNCFETIYRSVRVNKVKNSITGFFDPNISIISLKMMQTRIYLKYIKNNSIEQVTAQLLAPGAASENFALKPEESSNIILYKDIRIQDVPFDFGTIKRGFEDDGLMYIEHLVNGALEFKTFRKLPVADKRKEMIRKNNDPGNNDIFKDTGNRLKPMTFLAGTQGENELSRKLILTYKLMENSNINFVKFIPGVICDIIESKNDEYFVLSWAEQKKTGFISKVLPKLRPEKSQILKFTCINQPATFTFFESLNLFFLAMTGKNSLFCLDNSPGCLLQNITAAFESDTKNEEYSKLPENGEINDLEIVNLLIPDKNKSISFLCIAQANAVSLFYFKDIKDEN